MPGCISVSITSKSLAIHGSDVLNDTLTKLHSLDGISADVLHANDGLTVHVELIASSHITSSVIVELMTNLITAYNTKDNTR